MGQTVTSGWRLLKYLGCLIALVLLCAGLLSVIVAHAVEEVSTIPRWANPSVMAVQRVSPLSDIQHEPNLLSNLDCTLLTYRLTASSSMQTGCFSMTALGLLDSDSGTVIFNGTDEGVQLLPYSAHQVVVPWPGALDLLALDPATTGGSYVSIYKNPLASLQDRRNVSLQLTAKQLTAPPELPLTEASGKPLIVNPQTMAFSDNGSWMVVETLSGAFVRINLATLEVTAFTQAFGSQGSPALLKSQVAVSGDGQYVAVANKDAGSMRVYDLTTCQTNPANSQFQSCASYDYQPFLTRQVAGFQSVTHVRFVNDGLLSFEVHADNQSGSGVYELAPRTSIGPLIDYLGLGDSYTSGEGAFDYIAGTDTSNDMCHLSVHSYPLLLTRDLFSSAGGHSVACSGAVINDVGSTSSDYTGQVRGVGTLQQLQQSQTVLLNSVMSDYLPGYVAQRRFVQQYQPGIVTVSVGGNDIGFGDILQKCVVPHVGLHANANTCYSSYEDRLELTRLIDRTVPRWTALYKQLRAAAPAAQLDVIGYPQTAYDGGSCALNVHLNKSEIAFSEALIDYLNAAIKQAAVAAGARYVDIGQALAGHRLCEAASYDVAVNGLTAGTDAGLFGLRVFGKESYHPNALGHALIEAAILKQTDNFTSADRGATDSGSPAILNVPRTGRSINTLVPDDTLIAPVVQIGKSTPVQASGSRDGLRPEVDYSIRLDGGGGQVVGTAHSNNYGDISTSVVLPANTPPGEHSIDITGNNQDDEPVDVTQPIYVAASDNDADEDDIPDNLDTCPGAVNSVQDSDQDGIDDACDNFIAAPPGSGGQTGSGNGGSGIASGSSDHSSSPSQTDDSTPVSNSALVHSEPNELTVSVTSIMQSARLTGVRSAAAPTQLAVQYGRTRQKGHVALEPYKPFSRLYIIDWLPWLALLVIGCLAMVLGLGIRHTTSKYRQARALSTTISS